MKMFCHARRKEKEADKKKNVSIIIPIKKNCTLIFLNLNFTRRELCVLN